MAPPQMQHQQDKKKDMFTIVRIMQTDIPGHKNLLTGLTYLKGISWSISNAICKITKIPPTKKIIELSPAEIEMIIALLSEANKKFPKFLLNRRKDFETGEDNHFTGTTLDMKKEFDIRRLKKIRSYRGLRHATGQPTRGQRTKSHFRLNKRKSGGIKKGPSKPSIKPAAPAKK
ncbi:MAG: 30S ribosomal protein S13 [Candidatus Pacearchaeota archaeon]|jgi:small subunit ribosomal protein S13